MLQHDGMYFYAPYSRGGGLDAKIFDLEAAINVALSTGRIPIINTVASSKCHKLDNIKKKRPIHWDSYIDLSATKVLKVESDGTIKEIPDTLRYVYEQDFNFSLYSKDQIRYIDKTQLHDKENEKYPIICLLHDDDILKLKQSPSYKTLDCIKRYIKKGRLIPGCKNTSLFIVFVPSAEVNDLTDIVLNYFGTTRESMKVLSDTLYDLPRFPGKRFTKALGCYACMHVRYVGSAEHASRKLKESQDLTANIKSVVGMVYNRQDSNLPLYIMSNIMDDDYFDFLKPKYDIYRYTDFKELRERFVEREIIDHNLLYSVEKNIMRYAVVKILPHSRNQFIFEGPWCMNRSGLSGCGETLLQALPCIRWAIKQDFGRGISYIKSQISKLRY